MTIKFYNNTAIDCGTGFSVPEGCQIDLVAYNNAFYNVDQLFVVREQPSIYDQLGLPRDVPAEFVLEALQILLDNRAHGEEEKRVLLRGSRLFVYLAASADVVTILGAFIHLDQQSLVQVAYYAVRRLIE